MFAIFFFCIQAEIQNKPSGNILSSVSDTHYFQFGSGSGPDPGLALPSF
jgi:hypothetical protein